MPYYDYRCDLCQTTFEYQKSMDDPHPEICPYCDKSGVRRVFKALPFSGTFHERVRSIPETKPIEGTEVRPRSS
jgi:putative FmdB family regulatory protein